MMAAGKRSKQLVDPVVGEPRPIRRRWRDYRTASGRSPVEEFIDGLSDSDTAAVLAGMEEVRDRGLRAARHLEGEVWEVRVDGDRVIYRILFAEEGSRGQVLLALEGFNKKTQKTPPSVIKLAMRRLADWRRRGDQKRKARGKRPLHR
ncbi:MAG: type II toxin-antitoxin system RelE/ParE family toxin [Solirubrobacteraceae bacterium]